MTRDGARPRAHARLVKALFATRYENKQHAPALVYCVAGGLSLMRKQSDN